MFDRETRPGQITSENRKIVIFTTKSEGAMISIIWDRIDEALYLQDDSNRKTYKIFPSFEEGAPTVAAQLQKQKVGYVASSIPEGNDVTAEFSDLNTLYLNFTNKIYSSLLAAESISITGLANGYIRSISLVTSGSGYISTTYDVISDVGTSAQVSVSATPTRVLSGRIFVAGDGLNGFTNPFTGSVTGSPGGSGLTLEMTHSGGRLATATITSAGTGYQAGEILTIDRGNGNSTFLIESVDGGAVESATIVSGGSGYRIGDQITISGGDSGAIFNIDDVTASGPEVSYNLTVTEINSEEDKTNDVYLTVEPQAEYGTTHVITIDGVFNLAKESTSHEVLATTIDAPRACPEISSILMEAYGSGEQMIYPVSESEWSLLSNTDNKFIYYQEGLNWTEFLTKLNSTVLVPDSVTRPTTVYVYYKNGAYLLEDAPWIVGIIGSELDYNSSYEYVLYSLDIIGETYQLSPAGSSTYVCGTSEWGGNWIDTIQQFRINRV